MWMPLNNANNLVVQTVALHFLNILYNTNTFITVSTCCFLIFIPRHSLTRIDTQIRHWYINSIKTRSNELKLTQKPAN